MIPPLKIAMVAACPFPTSQGSQVLIRELSETLVRRGHEVHVVTYHFGEDIPCEGLIIHRIPELFKYNKFRSGPEIRKPILDILLTFKLYQVVREHGIQIMHCHNYEAPMAAFPVRFFRKVPVVYHSHNTMSDEFYSYFRLKIPQVSARIAAHLMDRFIPRRADFVVAINRKVADFLIGMGSSPKKVKYIPPGIDYCPAEDIYESRIRKEYGLGEGPIMIYAGNLDGYQRIDLLLQSLTHVFNSFKEAKLVILTSSDPSGVLPLANNMDISGNVVVIRDPSFKAVRQLFAIGSVALNSRISWSGFPIKLLNYMAAGLPVVAFKEAAPPILNGFNGILVPAGDTAIFGGRVIEVLRSPDFAHKIGKEAKDTVHRYYNWNEITEDIELVYAKLLNLNNVPANLRERDPARAATVI